MPIFLTLTSEWMEVTLTNMERVWEEYFGGPTKARFRTCCPWHVCDIAIGHLSLGSEKKTWLEGTSGSCWDVVGTSRHWNR